MELLVNQELRTADTHAVQNIQNVGEELNEIDWPRKAKMAKMTRTAVICLATATAGLSIVKDTHAGIKESPNTGLTSIVCPSIYNLHHRPLLDFLRAKDAKLDTHHRLNVRIWAMNSGRHLSSEL
jgi:preprotein translocase subunit SecE